MGRCVQSPLSLSAGLSFPEAMGAPTLAARLPTPALEMALQWSPGQAFPARTWSLFSSTPQVGWGYLHGTEAFVSFKHSVLIKCFLQFLYKLARFLISQVLTCHLLRRLSLLPQGSGGPVLSLL